MMNAEGVAVMTDVSDEVQRWTAKRKAAVVMSIVKGDTSAAEAARKHGLTIAEIERWSEEFFASGENALRARPKYEEAAKDEKIAKLQCGASGKPGAVQFAAMLVLVDCYCAA